MPLRLLLEQVNRPPAAGAAARPPVDEQQLVKLLPKIGCAVESLADTRQFLCTRCGKISDRTEAQGPPLHCTHCGADHRERPDTLRDLGPNRVIRLELLAVRPDIFDVGGMSRLVRGYLGLKPGAPRYDVRPPRLRVRVDPRLSEESSLRPHIVCAVLRGVRLDGDLIKLLMNLQEDLHWALGRNRKLASIGVYDLDTLRGDTFSYEAVAPDGVRFVPLGFSPDQPGANLTPAEILERHKTGQEFAHLLRSMRAYPLLRDGAGAVLSMPPIINSEATRVTPKSTQLFVDVTGLSLRVVERALAILVCNLAELLPEMTIEAVTIDGPEGARVTPDLAASRLTLNVAEASQTIGVTLDESSLSELLTRMGHSVEPAGAGELSVATPPFRVDVMHAVDLIEDAAIAYGYDHLEPALVPTFTVSRPREVEELSAVARRVLTGLGFHQVITLPLTSEAESYARWGLPDDPRAVKIENRISVEQTICRTGLLAAVVGTLSINRQHELPQQIFEIGDVCLFDPSAETGAREERRVAAAMIGTHVGYADIRAVADAFAHEMGTTLRVRAIEHPALIPGRAAAILDSAGEPIGLMGELHPRLLEAYSLRHAVSVFEAALERLLK